MSKDGILRYMITHKKSFILPQVIAEHFGIPLKYARKRLAEMFRQGYLERIKVRYKDGKMSEFAYKYRG